MNLIYNKNINRLIRGVLKPFRVILPDKFKFPVNGVFTVQGKNIPPFKMVTNPTSAVTKYVFWGNVEGFEFNAIRVFTELLKRSEVFFDIGANIGYYSLLASALKKDITIFAFEPMPSAYDFLEKNISINNFGNIKPVKLALSDEKGSATFFSVVNSKFPDLPQLTGDGSLNNHSSVKKFEFKVAVDSLDSFVSQNLGEKKIDLIKLDTEGNEHRVLSGSGKVLREHRPVIQCEILKNVIEKELDNILSNYNYLYFLATDRGLLQVSSFENNKSRFVDYYLVPAEKLILVKDLIAN